MSNITIITKKCSKCEKIKTMSEFHKKQMGKYGISSICKECSSKYFKDYRKLNKEKMITQCQLYYKENKEEILKKVLIYNRKTTLIIDGKKINGLNKRDWTGYCELCGNNNTKINYHHWDDKNPSKGIWICGTCHFMVTAYEHGRFAYLQRYIRLKRFLDKQFKMKQELKPEDN